ncbi:hypothetical protein [Methyloversatilis sp. XJ19-49]|uniref:hypothetical protein n=1 Tax=Methyloversatilis sp. XJ19-49 TaxID=2963429 RepID=UPI00211BC11A|nr:hypothetical protein [Methyloversatilis sp. XJ19-49]MCQ9377785.1 hypothetical protein [Methyloversatilis sp. XJ19-49]
MTKTKVTFRVPVPLWDAFSTQADDLFLKRAPFLDHVLSREIPHLEDDLKGMSLSVRGNRFISEALHRAQNYQNEKMELKAVNIEIQKTTADRLNAAVKRHNLVRDAFFCRLLILFRGQDRMLKRLGVSSTTGGRNDYGAPFSTSPLKAMEEVRDDPFFYLRQAILAKHGLGLYLVELPGLTWATCFVDDAMVPTTSKFKKLKHAMEEFEDFLFEVKNDKGSGR